VLASDNISEHDFIAIASGSKYKAVSHYFETTVLNFQHIFMLSLKLQLSALGKINEHFKIDNSSDTRWRFVWIVDFPLFEMDSNQIKSVHHPFTQPQTEITSDNLLNV